MADKGHQLSGFSIAAIACGAVWLVWLLVSLFSGGGVWRITDFDIILLFAMMISIPVLVVCCGVFLYRKSQGLPVFTVVVPVGPEIPSGPPEPPLDPLDPNYLLRNPPAHAQVTQHGGRRVVVLTDGSVIGEMLGGHARRFTSLDEFRAFIGT
jgi:hypothetical protein